MNIEMDISRRKFMKAALLKAASLTSASLLLPSCFKGKESEMPYAIKNQIEEDMAEVGLNQGKWYKLVPFQDLPANAKNQFAELPKSGLFALNPDERKFYFVLSAPQVYIKIAQAMDTKVKRELVSDSPEGRIEFDLSQFIDKKTGKVLKFQSAEDYVKIQDSITSVVLRGSKEDLRPIEPFLKY